MNNRFNNYIFTQNENIKCNNCIYFTINNSLKYYNMIDKKCKLLNKTVDKNYRCNYFKIKEF